MELLERYLLQIGRYLPKKDREDTLNELRSLLLDQYDSRNNGELEESMLIHNIIQDFGYPKDVALEYRSDQPLVSRELEPLMYLIIKIMSFTLPLSILLANLIGYLSNNDSNTIMDLLLEAAYTIPDILTSYITALGIIFIIFILINKYASIPVIVKESDFDPNSLPQIPKSVYKVSLFETVLNIFGSILFLYLINYQPGLITIMHSSVKEPLLNNNFDTLLPFLNIGSFVSLSISIIHLIKRRRNYTIATLEMLHGIYSVILLIVLATRDIFNPIIIDRYNIDFLPNVFRINMGIIGVVAIVVILIKYIRVLFSKKDRS